MRMRNNHTGPNKFVRTFSLTAVFMLCFPLFPLFSQTAPADSKVDELFLLRGEKDFFKQLTAAYQSVEDPSEALELMYKFLPVLENDEERHTLLINMARLEEQTGKLQKSQLHYQSAAFTGHMSRDYYALYHSMLILIELGDYDYAMVQARQIMSESGDTLLTRRSSLQTARILQLQGRQTEALTIVEELSSERKSLPADVLYTGWTICSAMPDEINRAAEAAAEFRTELKNRFPDSPEYGLLTGKNSAVHTVELSLGLRGGKTDKDLTVKKLTDAGKASASEEKSAENKSEDRPDETSAEPEKSTAIQTGSFRDAENARYMQRTLEDEGFTVLVTQAKTGEATYYRVLVPIPFDGSEEQLILQLKEKGFEGYPVY